MTNKQFSLAYSEAVNYADVVAFVSDLALSSMWEDAPDAEIPAERLEQLHEIWQAAHRSVMEIRTIAGYKSMASFAERLCIPYRTLQDWETGRRECAPWLRLMMQEALGLIDRS